MPLGRWRGDGWRFGARVVRDVEDLEAGDAVDDGVVHPEEEREAPWWAAVDRAEARDEVQLPGRPGEVEAARVDASDLRAQLAEVTGRGEGDFADVVFEVEVLVLHPPGVVDVERDAYEFFPEGAGQVDPLVEKAQDVVESDCAARPGRRVVDAHARQVVRRSATALGVEHEGIGPAELSHTDLPRRKVPLTFPTRQSPKHSATGAPECTSLRSPTVSSSKSAADHRMIVTFGSTSACGCFTLSRW